MARVSVSSCKSNRNKNRQRNTNIKLYSEVINANLTRFDQTWFQSRKNLANFKKDAFLILQIIVAYLTK